MQRFIWTSDVHLDRMDENERAEFKEHLRGLNPDGFILAGDIAEADSVVGFLRGFRKALTCPIYFVLGNHDFWGSSFETVRSEIRCLTDEHPDLYWLSESGVIALNSETALIGHEGWADARYAPVPPAGNVPRDFMRIEDFKSLLRTEYENVLNQLGDNAARHIHKVLLEAVAAYKHIYLVTHVPPFREASIDRSGRICNDEKLPFYTCQAVGDVILKIMNERPECNLTVLCGHTHEKCEIDMLPNLQIKVLDAGYGTWYQPGIIRI